MSEGVPMYDYDGVDMVYAEDLADEIIKRKALEERNKKLEEELMDRKEINEQIAYSLTVLRQDKVALEKRDDELVDFAIWMTGCGYNFTQHKHFNKMRDKLLKSKIMGKHLRYDYMEADLKQDINKHAQEQMKVLGITYSHNTPQSMGDQYWFWNCENIPDPLPKYLSILDQDPMSCIGFGLSEDKAKQIINYVKKDDEHN